MIQPECGEWACWRKTGTAEPVARDQIVRRVRGRGNIYFPCLADHEHDWQPYAVDPYSAICDNHSYIHSRSTPVAQSAPRNLLTRWDVSSIPANGIFLTKNKKNKKKMPNGWRTINSLVHKIRLHGRRGKGMAESFSRQKARHAPQKEGGLKILCDLPPV